MNNKAQLRFSNLILLILLFVGVMVGAGIIIQDFNLNYVETGIVNTTDEYDEEQLVQYRPSIEKLEETLEPIDTAFQTLADAEGGGFLKITGLVLTDTVPKMLIAGINSMPIFLNIIGESIREIGVGIFPSESTGDTVGAGIIITLMLMGLMVWMLFKAIEASRRYPV